MSSSWTNSASAVARVLARQSDYYAVLGGAERYVGAEYAQADGTVRRALVNAIEKAPRGKDRENAVSVAQSAHATLANPLTRAMYDGWRRARVPREGVRTRGDAAGFARADRTRAEVVRVRAEGRRWWVRRLRF